MLYVLSRIRGSGNGVLIHRTWRNLTFASIGLRDLSFPREFAWKRASLGDLEESMRGLWVGMGVAVGREGKIGPCGRQAWAFRVDGPFPSF